MKVQYPSINSMSAEQIAKLLLDYVRNTNKIQACVSRNRGGRKESSFTEAEVTSAVNHVIYKMVKKVEEYRALRDQNSADFVQKRQFEDVPLLWKYFDTALDHEFKDVANKASAQMRARYSETPVGATGVDIGEAIGSSIQVENRDHEYAIQDVEQRLKTVLAQELPSVAEEVIKGFLLLFKHRVHADKEFAQELGLNLDQALALKSRIYRLLSEYCRQEATELLKSFANNANFWDVGSDEAKAANKMSRQQKEDGLVPADLYCAVSSTSHMSKSKEGVSLKISVQVVRDNGVQAKEVVHTVETIEIQCASFEQATEEKKKLTLKVKQLEAQARVVMTERRRKASMLFPTGMAA